jgi:hypothetical protein
MTEHDNHNTFFDPETEGEFTPGGATAWESVWVSAPARDDPMSPDRLGNYLGKFGGRHAVKLGSTVKLCENIWPDDGDFNGIGRSKEPYA